MLDAEGGEKSLLQSFTGAKTAGANIGKGWQYVQKMHKQGLNIGIACTLIVAEAVGENPENNYLRQRAARIVRDRPHQEAIVRFVRP